MHEVPDCLNRRYQALDDLIQELSSAVSSRGDFYDESRTDFSNDPSIRLMCEFWDILKEDPDCNLTQAVKHRMGLSTANSTVFGPRHVTCYMASNDKKCGGCSKNRSTESYKDSTADESTTPPCKKCAAKQKQKPKTEANEMMLVMQDSKENIKEIPIKISKDKVDAPKYKPCCKDKIEQDAAKNTFRQNATNLEEKVKNREPIIPSRGKVTVRMPCTDKYTKMKAKPFEMDANVPSYTCKKCSVTEKIKSPVRLGPPRHDCGQGPPPQTDSSPLNRALTNLKQAASHDRQCNDKIQGLLESQARLKEQIQKLEERESQGLQMIKKADCMWTCMEDSFKKTLAESQKRQKDLLNELKTVEENNNKWRKNNKDLEFQMKNLYKLQQEITGKTNQKKNDIKVIDTEINNLKMRIDNYYKETNANKKSTENRMNASKLAISNYCVEINKLEEELKKENKLKCTKEKEGAGYIKEAREDLQKICKVLLQKRLHNEESRAEKKELEDEIDLLKQTLDQCKDKCSLKEKRMKDEIKRLTNEIDNFQRKCLRCSQFTDTEDYRKLCTDCPKCEEERLCKAVDEYCTPDPYYDCVCQSVKQKFLDNVFENMYTVLGRQSKTPPGKAVADVILNCLKRNTNGKLNKETRNVLREFILTTVKKNLNLTIVGGAVKTRCEMDNETYDQLMSCLKDIKAVKESIPMEDKGTGARKASCLRWGGSHECNCPHGPKACVCSRKAPPPLTEPGPNPPPDADDPGEEVTCPHHQVSCGVDCAMHGASDEHPEWKRDPCSSPTTCSTFSTNMRAAQCVLGPESLMGASKRHNGPVVPNFRDVMKIKHDEKPKRQGICRQGVCRQDYTRRPRQRIIEEVMGKYREVTPIENVSKESTHNNERTCLCSRLPIVDQKHLSECNSGSDWIVLHSIDALKQKLLQKRHTHICHTIERDSPTVNNRNKKLKVLLHPKSDKTKKDISMIADTDHSKTKYQRSYSSKIAKDLMTDLLVSDINREEYVDDPRFKWMTINAFLKQLSPNNSLTGDHAKQLKAGFRKKNTNNVTRMLRENKDKYDANTEISPEATHSQNIITKRIHKEDKILSSGGKKCLKIIIDKNRSNSDINLTKTSSGNLGIMLNENIIKIIDQMTLIDPQLTASFDRNKKLSFHYDKSDNDNEYDVCLKRNSSGTRQLEVVKEFINAINTKNIITETPIKIHTNMSKHDENTSITDLKSTKSSNKGNKKHDENTSISDLRLTTSSKKGNKNRNQSISKALNRLYDESKSMKLTVQGENGLRKSVDVPLTKTLSRNIAADVHKVLSLGKIAMNSKEYPVILTRTKTNSFLLKITKNHDDSNAIIRNTSSGSLLLLPLKPVLKRTDTGYSLPKETYFELKIKDEGSYVPYPQFIVKPISSKKYLVVVDKEYEKSIRDGVEDDDECCIKLFRTKSCNFEVHVDETNDFNARLVKSSSGQIEIIHEELNKKNSNKNNFKTLHDLLKSSSISSNELRKPLNAPRLITKSQSDSSLLERVKVLTPDNKELLSQPLQLKKTDSNQYAVILSKASKRAVIKNLKIYFKNNHCHGLIPVKRTNPGEITIALDSDYNKKTAFDCLKVSHSGNIYLILNKTDVDAGSKKDKKNINIGQTFSFTGKKSQHYIGKVQQPVNKATSTNCKGYPDSSFCDSSECVCAQSYSCNKNVKNNITPKDIKESTTSKHIKESIMSFYRPKMCGVDWKHDIEKNLDGNYKIIDKTSGCNARVSIQSLCSKSRFSDICQRKKSEVMKPVFPNHHHSTQQCFFVNTKYSYHEKNKTKGQDKCVSNHLLKTPDVFDKSVKNNTKSNRVLFREMKHYTNVDWESIEHLPPQLPHFLKQSVLPKLRFYM